MKQLRGEAEVGVLRGWGDVNLELGWGGGSQFAPAWEPRAGPYLSGLRIRALTLPQYPLVALRPKDALNSHVLPSYLISSAHHIPRVTHYLSVLFTLFFFWPHPAACGIFPNEGSNLCPLQWKRGFLATGPPQSCLILFLISGSH